MGGCWPIPVEQDSLEQQCELEPRSGGRKSDLLDSATETNQNLHKKIKEVQAQYKQERADFQYELDGS